MTREECIKQINAKYGRTIVDNGTIRRVIMLDDMYNVLRLFENLRSIYIDKFPPVYNNGINGYVDEW